MDYSQSKLIEFFKAGKFPGETGIPKHVETFISNVFIFESQVYKFYKNDNAAFNASFRNISENGTRFEFTKRDFKWNHALSPNIYTELLEVVAGAESVEVITVDKL